MLCLVLLLLAALGVGGSLGQPVPSGPRSGRGLPRPACRLSGLPAGPGVRPAQRYLWPGQCPVAGRPGPGQAGGHPPDGGLGRLPAHQPRRGPVLRPAGGRHRPGVLRPRQPRGPPGPICRLRGGAGGRRGPSAGKPGRPLVRGSQRIPIAGLADPGLAQRAGDPRPAEAILGDALAALRLSSQPFPLPLAHRPEWFPLYAEGARPWCSAATPTAARCACLGSAASSPRGRASSPGTTGGSTAGGRPGWWSAGGWATASSPLRVGNRPEVVVATLHPAPSVEGQ